MPTYEYECQKCRHRFEQFQRITEPAVQRCPKCHGRVRRLVSGGSGIIFKGNGFYITDYCRKNQNKTAETAPTGKTAAAKTDKSTACKESPAED